MRTPKQALIALGANQPSVSGAPHDTLSAALVRLAEKGADISAVSRFFSTPCFPAGAGPDYVNAAARIGFDGSPEALLDILHEVEAEFGRERVQRWGRRTCDIDLIAFGDLVLPDAATQTAWRRLPPARQQAETPGDIVLPHPRMQERAFVLVPLSEVAADWRHPLIGQTVSELLSALPEGAAEEVRPL